MFDRLIIWKFKPSIFEHSNSFLTYNMSSSVSIKGLIVECFLPAFHGGRNVSTIHEFSSDDLTDARDPPFSSHIL